MSVQVLSKKWIVFLTFLFLQVIHFGSRAGVMSVTTIDEVKQHLKALPQGSLVLVDVDDTLITPSSTVFHAKSPYRKLIDDLKRDQRHYSNFEQILSAWRLQRKPMLVSEEWPNLIQELRHQHNVYALTKMETGKLGDIPSMEAWRYEELTRLGFSFSPSFQGRTEQTVIEGSDTCPHPATFYKGIFITGSHSKGAVLEAFPDDFVFSHVVLIDDREEHLEDVERFCQFKRIPFLGILFKGMDLIAGEPIPEIAEFQKTHLIEHAEWLEDDVAAQRLQERQAP